MALLVIVPLTRFAACFLGLGLVLCPPGAGNEEIAISSLPPEELVIGLRAARLELMRGDRDEALRLLRELAETHPETLVPIMALWDYHRKYELPPDEVRRLRELLTRRLGDVTSPLPPGTLQYLVENPDAGEEEISLILDAARRRLAAEEIPDPQLLEAVGVLQARVGMFEEARAAFARAHELRPRSELLWRLFLLDRRLEHWEDAAVSLERLRGASDAAVVLRLAYVEVLAKLGRHEELANELAAMDFRRDPKVFGNPYTELLLRSAWDLRDAGKDKEAEGLFRQLIELEPDNRSARLAILYFYSSDEERRAHEEAVRLNREQEDDPTTLAQEGADLLAAGNAAGAFDLLERASRASPDSELIWFNLGLAATRLERWGVAEKSYARAAAINPSRVESVLQHGIALQKLERCKEAVTELERALDLDSALTQSHYYLYVCYTELGDQEAAGEHLRLYNDSR
jgi:tetratricopeptide (TPR) repeat protein